jgi:hypothetical protein
MAAMRRALREQGWQRSHPVTVISDGEAALPGLVRAAIGGLVNCILDWWHISMRVQHIQQALRGIDAFRPEDCAGVQIVTWRVGRLRHLIWNGCHEEARAELFGLRYLVNEAAYLNGEKFRPWTAQRLWICDEPWCDLRGNTGALINSRARYRSKLPILTSLAEGCVDEIANARMARKQCDGRLKLATSLPLAAWPGNFPLPIFAASLLHN